MNPGVKNILTKYGLDVLVAAEAAVLFPAPIMFHPFTMGHRVRCAKDIYESQIAQGIRPLDALAKSVEMVKTYNLKDKEL